MENLYVIIPAYNEEMNIKAVIESWYPIVEQYGTDSRLVVIDDGSKDGTFNVLKQYAKARPLLVPMQKDNGGHGSTVLFGYQYAINQGADYIFQTDSDGQTVAEEFHAFWEKREEYDMLIGSRIKREDGLSRVFVTKTLKAVIRICFGVFVEDANTPFRLMKGSALKQYIGLIPDGFNLSNVLISVIFEKKGLKVKYLPISFRPRQGGENSINLLKIFRIGVQAIKDFRMIGKKISF